MKIRSRILWVGVSFIFISFSFNKGWAAAPSWGTDDSTLKNKSSVRIKERIVDISPYSPGSHNIALDLGQVFLMGDLTRFADSIGSQLHYTYGVSDLFAFDSSVGYSEHSDSKFSMTSLLAGMRMNMSWYDKVIPYAVFGLGFYHPSYRDTLSASGTVIPTNTEPVLSSVLFVVHLLHGIDLELSRNVFFGAALTFHTVFGSAKTLANGTPFNLGGTYASFFLHAGVTF